MTAPLAKFFGCPECRDHITVLETEVEYWKQRTATLRDGLACIALRTEIQSQANCGAAFDKGVLLGVGTEMQYRLAEFMDNDPFFRLPGDAKSIEAWQDILDALENYPGEG
jgi:hypothetical protein